MAWCSFFLGMLEGGDGGKKVGVSCIDLCVAAIGLLGTWTAFEFDWERRGDGCNLLVVGPGVVMRL